MIYFLEDKISIVNIYINDFFLLSDIENIFSILKPFLVKKDNTKYSEEIETIIR